MEGARNENAPPSGKTSTVLPARDNNTQTGAASSRITIITSVNECLQAVIGKRLYDEVAAGDLLWHVAGYLGGFEHNLRNNPDLPGCAADGNATDPAESLNLTIPKVVMDRAGAKAGDYVCARGTLRVAKQFRPLAFEVYLSVTELQLLDAPATLNARRQEIHLADAEVGCR